MAVGLAALAPRTDVALVCSTDLPFLHPAFLQRLLALRADADVVLPVVHGFRQPLVAGYRTSLAERARELLAQDRARPASCSRAPTCASSRTTSC
jgi:molybdopterin-guanine dinucleotide biosynthesis protein A